MIARRSAFVTAVVVVVVAMLAGCSGSSVPDASAVSADDSPLMKYLLALTGNVSDEERAAQSVEVEEVIAACMAKEGFEYVPVSHDDPFYKPDEWRPDDAEWVAQWGYGIVDFPGMREMQAAQAEGDPNSAYFESLSEAEQAAFAETLVGPSLSDAELAASLDGTDLQTWDEQGCTGLADHQVRGVSPLQTGENLALRKTISDFRETQFEAPEFAELNAEWADCMADAGHPGYENQPAVRLSFADRVSAIYITQTESDYDDPRVRDLHEEEIDVALADLACREGMDYASRSLVIQYAQEEQFIADHQEELDALMSEAEQGR